MKFFFIRTLLVAFCAGLMIPSFAHAQISLDKELYPQGAVSFDQGDAKDEYSVEGFRANVVLKFLNIVLGTVGMVTVFFLMFNAFMLAKSGGNEEDLPKYKKGLTWALVGLLAIILSYSIIRSVITLTFTAEETGGGAGQTQGAGAAGRR